jgi:hypothetical protein
MTSQATRNGARGYGVEAARSVRKTRRPQSPLRADGADLHERTICMVDSDQLPQPGGKSGRAKSAGAESRVVKRTQIVLVGSR